MATFGQLQDPRTLMAGVQPRTGFPVQKMGGMPQTPMDQPLKPFVTSPTISAPRGPAGVVPPMQQPGSARGVAVGAPRTPAGPLGRLSPVPSPTAAPSPAPAPTPASAGPATTPTGSTASPTGPAGTTPQAGGWKLEDQLQKYLSGAFEGSVSPEFINRAKGDVFRTVQGQTKSATQQINDDAVRRGLYRSGIPAESIANVQGQAQGAMARGVADILNAAEAQNIQGRQAAAGTAQGLLGMNREQARYEQERADAARARAAANQPQTFRYQDPDTLEWYDMEEDWF